MHERIALWMVATAALLCSFLPLASAQTASDYTHGITMSGSTGTLWFAPASSATSWVDVHYTLGGGDLQT